MLLAEMTTGRRRAEMMAVAVSCRMLLVPRSFSWENWNVSRVFNTLLSKVRTVVQIAGRSAKLRCFCTGYKKLSDQ